jgi:hypothetical protein
MIEYHDEVMLPRLGQHITTFLLFKGPFGNFSLNQTFTAYSAKSHFLLIILIFSVVPLANRAGHFEAQLAWFAGRSGRGQSQAFQRPPRGRILSIADHEKPGKASLPKIPPIIAA